MILPRRYEPKEAEQKWQKFWEDNGIYLFNPESSKPVYSIDMPPITVSGGMHMGHAFSYVQAEALARYHRMKGEEVFYPGCFDDNGLPSERFTEKIKNIKAQDIPRSEFKKLCLEVISDVEDTFRQQFTRFGFSCDWNIIYSTIDSWVQRISQRSFLELFEKDRIYRKKAPTLWCPECQTAVAQAETEDREIPAVFYNLIFTLSRENGTIPIATTRPELLPACVAVFVNPNDEKWKDLIGKKAVIPVFNREVEIYGDDKVAIDKGSGIVMCCTFGDTTDIEWWKDYNLDLRIVFDNRGHMNKLAGFLEGMYWKKARKVLIDKLSDQGFCGNEREIDHMVNVHERCGTPLEYLVNKQWFIRVLDLKDELKRRGEQIKWHPPMFKVRFDHWVENLKWDWCISRQRYFGVPFPVWFCSDCGKPITANPCDLPVDPLEDDPPGPCSACGSTGYIPETDVLDTWATSSLTPQINARWKEENEKQNFIPMDMRPHAHDIIRTWNFYTIVKAHLHNDSIPWKNLMISGHALNCDRKKMSKSKGNIEGDPIAVLEKYSADQLRYWACSSKLGTDVAFSPDVLGEGRRLVTKLFNAARFTAGRLEGYNPEKPVKLYAFDRWILARLSDTVRKATRGMEEFEYAICLRETESFFWKAFCDNYLEIVKGRLYNEDKPEAREAAQHSTYTALYSSLRLFAPVLVHITEELYQAIFREFEKHRSIHVTPWPSDKFADNLAMKYGDMTLQMIEEARRYKSENNLSMAAPLKSLRITGKQQDLKSLKLFEDDLISVTRAERILWIEGAVEQPVTEVSG